MQKKVSVFAFLFVLFVCLFGIGCASEPKVDTSNDQAFVKSIAEIYKALPEPEKPTSVNTSWLQLQVR